MAAGLILAPALGSADTLTSPITMTRTQVASARYRSGQGLLLSLPPQQATGVSQPVGGDENLPENRVYASKDRLQRDRGDRSQPARSLPGRNAQALLRRAYPGGTERLRQAPRPFADDA